MPSAVAQAVLNGMLKLGAESGLAACVTLQRFVPLVFLPLAAYTYKKPLDLLPLSAFGGRLVSFQATDMLTMKLIQLVALTPWLPFAIAIDSFPALLTAILSIVLQVVGIWNLRRIETETQKSRRE